MDIDRRALEQWQREQPLCILQLDAADRTVLKVAGRTSVYFDLDQGLISPTSYSKPLHPQIPKAVKSSVLFAILGSARVKALHKIMVKSSPGVPNSCIGQKIDYIFMDQH